MAARELESQLSQLSQDARRVIPASASALLRLIREARLPRPDIVLSHGEHALRHSGSHTRTYWEQVAYITRIALEQGERSIALRFLRDTLKRFPESRRAKTLIALARETQPRWLDAASLYARVALRFPMDPAICKRQVAWLKARRNVPQAASLLSHYLDFHPYDCDAWAELCALALRLGRSAHALFAANELLVLHPDNHAAHITVADVYMTIGDSRNVASARAYYANSLDLRKTSNLRALYGLWLACSILINSDLVDDVDKEKSLRLLKLAQAGIRAVYNNPDVSSVGKLVAVTLETDIYAGA